ncbi:MAG: 5-hydroxyisourate hydrolase [Blastocatellia bacterium]|jgi:5-hydroxyisourate hydrolase|nr:5-hydroxyisourate hydrolase [Blastocatellia bacterium]
MSAITTHVLDTARGRPAPGVPVSLSVRNGEGKWEAIGQGLTDADGRLKNLVAPDVPLALGVYRLTFDVAAYFSAQAVESFYEEVSIVFKVEDAAQHYHVPLLLSPYGYSTYRGS